MTLQTAYAFTLPKGYVDDAGTVHRAGVMRLATARDELEPMRDPRVASHEPYLTILILSRVVTELGGVTPVGPDVIEGLFAGDLAYLRDLYAALNFGDDADLAAVEARAQGEAGGGGPGGGRAAPVKRAAKSATRRSG